MANPSTGTVRRGLASVSDGKPRNTNKKACGAAFFDVDGTLIDIYTSPLHFTYWMTWHARGVVGFTLLASVFPLFVLVLVVVDKFSRKASNKLLLYIQFAALPVERARELCAKYMQAHLGSRLLTSIAARLKLHAAKGDLVMLVSAGPLPFVLAFASAMVSPARFTRGPSADIFIPPLISVCLLPNSSLRIALDRAVWMPYVPLLFVRVEMTMRAAVTVTVRSRAPSMDLAAWLVSAKSKPCACSRSGSWSTASAVSHQHCIMLLNASPITLMTMVVAAIASLCMVITILIFLSWNWVVPLLLSTPSPSCLHTRKPLAGRSFVPRIPGGHNECTGL